MGDRRGPNFNNTPTKRGLKGGWKKERGKKHIRFDAVRGGGINPLHKWLKGGNVRRKAKENSKHQKEEFTIRKTGGQDLPSLKKNKL